ncbi:uncharacterized protein LOC110709509 [Chenopodium quinoa]|uniref:uncharacterized protein LOC110709509 n=1 Tax=Chenopodium quinoa TaxID=63459 RepID=UPI000B793265|nr:uncharacterized protein LOC110709509 [Chenopodium quinoa]
MCGFLSSLYRFIKNFVNSNFGYECLALHKFQDSELFYECMRALKAFASFHYKETIARKVGLGSYAASGVKASFKGSCFHSSFLPPFIMNFALRPLASILRSS